MRASVLTVVLLLSGLFCPAAAEAPAPDRITLETGGMFSVPTRTVADLATGEFTLSEPPLPPNGSRAYDLQHMEVKAHWILSPERLAAFRHAVDRLWHDPDALQTAGVHTRHRRGRPPEVILVQCPIALDFAEDLVLERAGQSKTIDVNPNCLSRTGKTVLAAFAPPQ